MRVISAVLFGFARRAAPGGSVAALPPDPPPRGSGGRNRWRRGGLPDRLRSIGVGMMILTLALMVAAPAFAVEPDEMLADPVLEARARAISKEVRCLVCRNESIDDSSAALARDLRLLVRERLVAGDSDAEVRDYLVARYGEFVLLKPRFSAANALLWLAGPIAFLLGLLVIVAYHRTRRPHAEASEAPLSDEEKQRLEDILKG